jgi:hypothetical protein
VHDFNGGILPSGLFWTLQLPHRAFRVSRDGSRATLEAKDLCVGDSFQFLGPNSVPATVSFRVEWVAESSPETRGSGSDVPPEDPAAFLGLFADARATGTFSGSELGFSFRSEGEATSDEGYAELGPERNGVFLG